MPGIGRYRFGPFCLDASRRLLTRHDQHVALTARAFDVLVALVERAGRTVEKDELLEIVWPDTVVEEANLSQQIFTIRKLLGQSEHEAYIATVPRRGYRFVADLDAITDKPAAPSARVADGAPRAATLRLAIPLTPSAPLAVSPAPVLAISPDGARLVYVATVRDTTQLFVRTLDRFDAVPIEGTEGAVNPFFSPDGQCVGFQCGRELRKIMLAGGRPLRICELEGDMRGADWGAGDLIVFAGGPASGLCQVSAAGGAVHPVTTLRFERGERTHRWPHLLPGGRAVLFTVGNAGATSFDDASLAVAEIESGGHRIVLQHATDGRWLPTGHLLWARGGSLMSAAFDPGAGVVQGTSRVVMSGVAVSATGVAQAACSATGLLVHVPGTAETVRRSLVTVERSGAVVGTGLGGDAIEEPRLAPDGSGAIIGMRGRASDLWLYHFGRGTLTRVTFDGENFAGIWGPEPGTVTFSSSRGGAADLYVVQPDRTVAPELLVASEFDKIAGSWSADGACLLFTEYHPESGVDIWVFDRRAGAVRPFVRTRFNEHTPVLSANARYVAYTSDESGRPEIYVVDYPGAAGKRQLSTEGGVEPLWSRDGRELFYRSGDRLMRVDMSRGPVNAGVPTTVFEGRFVKGTVTCLSNYDVAADNERFFMVVEDAPPAPTAIHVTVGWFADLTNPMGSSSGLPKTYG